MEDSIVMSNPNDPYNILSTLGWSQNTGRAALTTTAQRKALKIFGVPCLSANLFGLLVYVT